MLKKLFRTAIIAFFAFICIFSFIGCGKSKDNANNNDDTQTNICEDVIENRVMLGKKYYSLGYMNYTKNEYYTINEDGTATYTHIMQDGDKITFHQEINFRWNYAGNSECILVHNGTKMIKGEQDDAFGISRVIHLSKAIIYWSTSGENTYFICEDYVSEIPNYSKLIK